MTRVFGQPEAPESLAAPIAVAEENYIEPTIHKCTTN
jgi:hypothetical protein